MNRKERGHNTLPDVSPENIMTMYEAVWEFGES